MSGSGLRAQAEAAEAGGMQQTGQETAKPLVRYGRRLVGRAKH